MNRQNRWRTVLLPLLAVPLLTCTDGPVGTASPGGDAEYAPQLASASNNQPPVAIPGAPYQGVINTASRFDGSASSDPDGPSHKLTYDWNFGDGTRGTGATPSHTYTRLGTYTVTLVVKDAKGAFSAPASTTITIKLANVLPTANAGGQYSGVAGSEMAFDGSASSDPDEDEPLTYAWNFGDGSTGTGMTPTHTYAAAGSYTVTLRVTDTRNGQSPPDTTTAIIAAPPNQAPVASAGGPYSGTAGAAIQFNGDASSDPDGNVPLTYAWNFGDGDGTTGTDATPTHSYTSPGSYTVTLTVTDAKGLSSAPASTSASITSAPPPPPPNQAPVANAGGPYSGAAGSAIQFNGGASSDPDGNVPLTYAWNFGDGGTATVATPTHTYASAGSYTVTLTVKDAKGLSSAPASTSASIASAPPPPNQAPVANAGGPYSGTAGSAIQFNGSASSDPDGNTPLTYAWNFGDGTTGTGATPTHTYTSAGSYTVTLTVTDAKGLSSAPATAAVTVGSASLFYLKDTFSRSVSQGWGSADVGGAWYAQPAGPTFRVDGSRGIIEVLDATPANVVGRGPVHGSSALESYGLDVEGLVSFSLDRAPDAASRFHTIHVYARRNDRKTDGDNYYRYRVRVFGTSAMDVRIEKNVNGATSNVTDYAPANTTFSPGAKYWIRWQAVGTHPTTVRMRVWRDGMAEPAAWQASAVVDVPALDVSGTTGFRFQGPSADQRNWPVRFSVDDLQYTRKNP